MNNFGVFNIAILLVLSLSCQTAFADRKYKSNKSDESLGDIASIIEETVVEVVDNTVDKAKDMVREHTGIDLEKRGYGHGRNHKSLPRCASDNARRKLNQLSDEYNSEIAELEVELDRKLDKAEAEFKREAAKEDKAEKVKEKRRNLEKKVDEAYANFDEKVTKHNEKFDKKRDKIVNKERGSEHCKNARDDEDEDEDEDRDEHKKRDHDDDNRDERGKRNYEVKDRKEGKGNDDFEEEVYKRKQLAD